MKIAVVHDWLVTYAGAERVLEQILQCFPEADVFSVVDFIPPDQRSFLLEKPTIVSFVQSLPLAKKHYRTYLPIMPLAIEQMDLAGYDLVISNSHAVAKGIITSPNQLHLSYIHSPMRYAWDLQHQYLRETGLSKGLRGWAAKALLHYLRLWDLRTANGVDFFAANSNFIAKRIWKVYRRQARVIYPPVDIQRFTPCAEKDDYYLTASRMVPYKKMDLIVEAFGEMPNKRLVVIGDGPEFAKIQSKAASNIELLGYQSFENLRAYMQRARAFVFAAEEDFGIAPVEAQACGTPVIAFGRGGVTETVQPLGKGSVPTGVFFNEQTVRSLCEAVIFFDKAGIEIDWRDCRENAERFSIDIFQREFKSFVTDAIDGNFSNGDEDIFT